MIDTNTFSIVIVIDNDFCNYPIDDLNRNSLALTKLGIDEILIVYKNLRNIDKIRFPFTSVLVTYDTAYDEMLSIGAEASSGDFVIESNISNLRYINELTSLSDKNWKSHDVILYTTGKDGNLINALGKYITNLSSLYSGNMIFSIASRRAVNRSVMYGDYLMHRSLIFKASGSSIFEIHPSSKIKIIGSNKFRRAFNTLTSSPKIIEKLVFLFFLISLAVALSFSSYALFSYIYKETISGWVSAIIFNGLMFAILSFSQYFILRLIYLNFQYVDKRNRRKPILIKKIY